MAEEENTNRNVFLEMQKCLRNTLYKMTEIGVYFSNFNYLSNPKKNAGDFTRNLQSMKPSEGFHQWTKSR